MYEVQVDFGADDRSRCEKVNRQSKLTPSPRTPPHLNTCLYTHSQISTLALIKYYFTLHGYTIRHMQTHPEEQGKS